MKKKTFFEIKRGWRKRKMRLHRENFTSLFYVSLKRHQLCCSLKLIMYTSISQSGEQFLSKYLFFLDHDFAWEFFMF